MRVENAQIVRIFFKVVICDINMKIGMQGSTEEWYWHERAVFQSVGIRAVDWPL